MIRFDHYPHFVTITNLHWLPILQNEQAKQIIIEALQHRVNKKLVTIYGFVIMPNHFHAIWQLHDGVKKEEFQRDLLKFTARSILKFQWMNNVSIDDQLKVGASDRDYQVWERNSLWLVIFSEPFFLQKLNYIHSNPLQPKWKLATVPEEYFYSSALFYEKGIDHFGLLTHYRD